MIIGSLIGAYWTPTTDCFKRTSSCLQLQVPPSLILLSLHPYIYPYIHLSIRTSIHTSIYPSMHPSIQPSIDPAIHILIHQTIRSSMRRSIQIFIHRPSIHQSTNSTIHAYTNSIIHACTNSTIHACTNSTIHACTMHRGGGGVVSGENEEDVGVEDQRVGQRSQWHLSISAAAVH